MPLSREELYELWAPPGSPWSLWAKPVLFANARPDSTKLAPFEAGHLETFGYLRDAAIVVDVPGVRSVLVGLALAQNGYRPVPLYNGAAAPSSLINMGAIADALAAGAARLQRMAHQPDARPAFLLNADRMDHSAGAMAPGRFDNRWCVVPQDMPSATFLKSAGINQVVLIAESLADDLAHVLYRYQEAKLELRRFAKTNALEPLNIPRPNAYKAAWYRAAVFAGLRRNAAGGFGGITPDPGDGIGGVGG